MSNTRRYLVLIFHWLLLTLFLTPTQNALAHGYLDDPLPSRALLCQRGVNVNCGPVQYEPQSAGEAAKGFFDGTGGAPDGKLASGNNALFSGLDAQSATRWHLTEIKDASVKFMWTYKAPHPVAYHKYYITKNGWDPNQPLSRNSFDKAPFCVIPGSGTMPVAGTIHSCVIPPDKRGQHVIVGAWGVGDTAAEFLDPVDVMIETSPGVPGFNPVGTIAPRSPLLPGDRAKVRAFTAQGENPTYSTELQINTAQQGEPSEWAYLLAKKINDTQPLMRAGRRNDNGDIVPERGPNEVYANLSSGVTHIEIQLTTQEDQSVRMAISALATEYPLVEGKAKMRFPILTTHAMDVDATLLDSGDKSVGSLTAEVAGGTTWLEVDVNSKPGMHKLVLNGTTLDGRTSRQDTQNVNVTGSGGSQEYDFIFPDQLTTYKAGTRVLQQKNNTVYECKPFPYSGYCKQWTSSTTQYEPGTGSNSSDAWIELKK